MKKLKIVLLGITILTGLILLSGCRTDVNDVNGNSEDYRFIKIYDNGSVKIYYDKETKVEYAVRDNGHGGTSMTLLVDADGKPLLYQE